ncbi:MAG TPA: hypothetical protein VH062_02155 [Polyangiaceae bacterium]|jgi:hypothetical protein|nr:hypothetical protein [Polyangiaceae bacterium]
MTFARVWPTGIGDNVRITGATFTQIDLNISRAVDGYAGGKVSPIAPIRISGGGLAVSDRNEDAFFSTFGAKWLGAAMDLIPASTDSTVGSQPDDVCSQGDGFMALVDSSAAGEVKLSTDGGASWQDPTTSGFGSHNFQCCASSDIITLFGASDGSMRSADLRSGTSSSLAITGATVTLPGSPTSIDAIFYDQVHDLFVAIGKTSSTPYIATLTNTATPVATQRTPPAAITGSNAGLKISQRSNGRLVASWIAQTKLAYSDDGVTWTASTTTFTAGAYTHTFGDGVFLAVSTAGVGNFIATSIDGDVWVTGTARPSGNTLTLASPRCLTALYGVFVASFPLGQIYFSIDRGATWILATRIYRSSPTVAALSSFCVRAIKGRLFFGMNGQLYRSRLLGSHAAGL